MLRRNGVRAKVDTHKLEDLPMKLDRPCDIFKQEFLVEWHRLNPKFCTPGDGVADTLKHAFREGLHGYFAPLWMLGWLLRFVAKRIFQAPQA